MTQKDLAFVADFLSEHFSAVSTKEIPLFMKHLDNPFKAHLLIFFAFCRIKSCLIGKGSISTLSELDR